MAGLHAAQAAAGRIGGAASDQLHRRLPAQVNRALYVRNLPYKITAEEMYDLFGKYGAVRQIRKGTASDTRGTAFVVYEDIYDAKRAVDHLSGFNVGGRYLVVLYYQTSKMHRRKNIEDARRELEAMKKKHKLNTEEAEAEPR